jgi:hypothetical protein
MTCAWQTDAGRLECRWSEVGQRSPYHPLWMQEASNTHGSYLSPPPDFANHSPFVGPSWLEGRFQSRRAECDSR